MWNFRMKMYKPWYQVASTLKKKSMTVQTRKKCQCLRLFSSCFCIHRKSRKRNEKSQFNLALTVRLGMGIQTPAGRLYCHHCDSFSRLIKNKSGKIVLKWSHFNRMYRCPIRRSLESNLGNFRNKLRDNCV